MITDGAEETLADVEAAFRSTMKGRGAFVSVLVVVVLIRHEALMRQSM